MTSQQSIERIKLAIWLLFPNVYVEFLAYDNNQVNKALTLNSVS